MVSTLRNELDNKKIHFEESRQKEIQLKESEFKQLHETIFKLRSTLEKKNGRKKR